MDIPLTSAIQIRPILPEEIDAARYLILSVARTIYAPDQTAEAFNEPFIADTAFFADMDLQHGDYLLPDGLLLVALDDGRLIGTGAVRRHDEQTAELKRMWLLEGYHGQGIGYRLLLALIDFARQKGYRRMVLTTGDIQERAIQFYRRVGFEPIALYLPKQDEGDVAMEMML